jgi:hypothetical protein
MAILRLPGLAALARALAFFAASPVLASAADVKCRNLVQVQYNKAPAVYAPDESRGKGVKIWIKGTLQPLPDTTAGCLPIPVRYNNPGSLKTRSAGPWPQQISKDAKGHAVFSSVEAGIAAWGMWIKRRTESGGAVTAMSLMSIYAPTDDCVGSVGVPPNCPFGINPTRAYAERLAAVVGKHADDRLNINGNDCDEGRSTLYSLFLQVFTFETGADFCGRKDAKSDPLCVIDRDIFDRAMDEAYGGAGGKRCTKKI